MFNLLLCLWCDFFCFLCFTVDCSLNVELTVAEMAKAFLSAS